MRTRVVQSLALIVAILLCATGTFAQRRARKPATDKNAPAQAAPAPEASSEANSGDVVGKRIGVAEGRTFMVDGAGKQGTVVWYTRGGVTQSLDSGVTKIEPVYAARKTNETTAPTQPAPVKPAPEKSLWIYLVGGARFK